jgi:hypothetical protein
MKILNKLWQRFLCCFRGHKIGHGLRFYRLGPTNLETDKIWGSYLWCGHCDRRWTVLDDRYKN